MPITLIKKGKAYVDELSAEEMREYRGTLTESGKESPRRRRELSDVMQDVQSSKRESVK